MSAPIVAFFNNKGGVGKTSLVYHLAWMFSDLGVKVLAADLDPQANLTAAVVGEDVLEIVWDLGLSETVYNCVELLITGTGEVRVAQPREVSRDLHLIDGDLRLSNFEDILATGWGECLGSRPRGFSVTSAFWKLLTKTAELVSSDVILIDLGPNLGAINRAALLAADYLVVPLAADLFSLQGMKNLGPTVTRWKAEWQGIRDAPSDRPRGAILPIGYVVQQHSVRLDRPVKSYEKWMARIPDQFRSSLLDEQLQGDAPSVKEDPWCLALLKHYHSLMPMAQEARKPMFHLTPADGAIGAHSNAARSAGLDFRRLAKRIAVGAGLNLPQLERITI